MQEKIIFSSSFVITYKKTKNLLYIFFLFKYSTLKFAFTIQAEITFTFYIWITPICILILVIRRQLLLIRTYTTR